LVPLSVSLPAHWGCNVGSGGGLAETFNGRARMTALVPVGELVEPRDFERVQGVRESIEQQIARQKACRQRENCRKHLS